jgi:LmbE family N-acetylglucosaminyl deacetylase
LLVELARDITQATSRRSALVLAPHCDDETIGCGATIARKVAAGCEVRVVVAADGNDDIRRGECHEACRRLGLSEHDVIFLGFPDGSLREHREALGAELRAILAAFSADEVFAPYGIDAHPDHRALAATMDALHRELPRGTSVLGYPVWLWNRWAWADPRTSAWEQRARLVWRPFVMTATVRTRIVRTGPYAQVKKHALEAHRSQVDNPAGNPDRKALDPEWLAGFLGSEELFFAVRPPQAR